MAGKIKKMFFSFLLQKKAESFLKTRVSECMNLYPITIKTHESVIQAATKMIGQGISSIIVKDNDEVKGLVTERDFINKVALNSTVLNKKVADIMTGKLISVSPKDTLESVFELMKKNNIRKVVVMDQNKLLGIITQKDLLSLFHKNFARAGSSKSLVSDWMTKNIIFVSSKASFSEAKSVMKTKDVGAIFVQEKKDYVGLFTEHDIVAQLYDQGGILKIGTPKEVMSPYIRCIEDGESVFFANTLMLTKNIRRLGVIKDNKLVGVITQTDVAQAMFFALEEMKKQKLKSQKIKKRFDEEFISEHLKIYA